MGMFACSTLLAAVVTTVCSEDPRLPDALNGVREAAARESSARTWVPSFLSSADFVASTPPDLRLPAGVDVGVMPRHPMLGADVGRLVTGRELSETRIPDGWFWWKTRVVKNHDTNGDGLADTFVAMDLWNPTRIASVTVGAPPTADGPRTTYFWSGQKIWRIEVTGRRPAKEIFTTGYHQKVGENGIAMTRFDHDEDGFADSVYMGNDPHSNAPNGWPYVGYSPAAQ